MPVKRIPGDSMATQKIEPSVLQSIGTTKGDIFVFTADETPARLGVGSNGQVLTADSGEAAGVKWADAAGVDAVAFLVKKSTDQSNISTGSNQDVTWQTEIKDVGNDFASHIFTAPVDGMYHLTTILDVRSIDTAAGLYQFTIDTSNRVYFIGLDPNFSSDPSYLTICLSILADMDASDTAKIKFYQSSGTAQTDIDSSGSYFSGCLIAEY